MGERERNQVDAVQQIPLSCCGRYLGFSILAANPKMHGSPAMLQSPGAPPLLPDWTGLVSSLLG